MGHGQRQHTNKTIQGQTKYKYPRTPHLPESPKSTADDLFLTSTDVFEGTQVIVSEKLDGESCTMARDYIHARSPDAIDRSQTIAKARAWVRSLHGRIAHDIPKGWRICGENLGGRHTIAYSNLPSLFFVYSIWDDNNNALSWQETQEWCNLLELHHVPVLYQGIWNKEKVLACANQPTYSTVSEGFTVRIAQGFSYADFGHSIAKFVNKSFQIPDEHWSTSPFVPNELKSV